MVEIIYDVKDTKGYLVQKTKRFSTESAAMSFIRNQKGIIGKPTLINK